MQSQIKGYLNDPYRVFYNIGVPAQEVAPHYHDFRKIVILLDGEIGYMVEDAMNCAREAWCLWTRDRFTGLSLTKTAYMNA